jgi:hypothetical protein
MIKREIYVTGINLSPNISPNEVDDDTFLEVSFTELENNMVLNMILPMEIVKTMQINQKYELVIKKLE